MEKNYMEESWWVTGHFQTSTFPAYSRSPRSVLALPNELLLKMTKKFVLKDQGNPECFPILLKYADSLEVIVLDCRGKGSSNENDVDPSSILTDHHLQNLPLRNRDCIHSLIIRGSTKFSYAGYLTLASCCTHLTALDLSHSPFLSAQSLIPLLKSNPRLTYLSLEKSYNAVNDEVMKTLGAHCPLLKTLSVSYCSAIGDQGVIYVSDGCNSLQEVSLAHCYDVGSDAICYMLRKCRHLSVMSLEWCFNTDDSVLECMKENCPNISVLGIEHCIKISDIAMADCVSHLPRLSFLSLDNCEYIGASTVASLAHVIPTIVDLYLNCCPFITDQEIIIIAKACKNLRSLGIEECKIGDSAVFSVADNCSQLKVLGLNGNRDVTDLGVMHLVQRVPYLEKLYLSYTSVTNLSLITLARCSRALKSLSVVGCEIDSRGLMPLGNPFNACSVTLQDLHVAHILQYPKHFHAHQRRSHSCKGSKPPHPLHRTQTIEPSVCRHKKASKATGTGNQSSSLPKEDDSESTFGDDETESNNDFGSPLNLRKVIFRHHPRESKACVVYLR